MRATVRVVSLRVPKNQFIDMMLQNCAGGHSHPYGSRVFVMAALWVGLRECAARQLRDHPTTFGEFSADLALGVGAVMSNQRRIGAEIALALALSGQDRSSNDLTSVQWFQLALATAPEAIDAAMTSAYYDALSSRPGLPSGTTTKGYSPSGLSPMTAVQRLRPAANGTHSALPSHSQGTSDWRTGPRTAAIYRLVAIDIDTRTLARGIEVEGTLHRAESTREGPRVTREAFSARNLVTNGGFEFNVPGLCAPGYTDSDPSVRPCRSWPTRVAGTNTALQSRASAAGHCLMSTPIVAHAGDTYAVGGDVQAEAATEARMGVEWIHSASNGRSLATVVWLVTNRAAEKTVAKREFALVEPPATATTFRLWLCAFGPNTQHVTFDDVFCFRLAP